MKKILFIVNPISGTSNKSRILKQIDKLLDKSLYSYEVVKTEHAGHAELIARDAVEKGIDIVCAIGGDGTVNEVARGIINTNTALAIIPCGSGNGLARHLHIPMDATRAIKLINSAVVHKIDYGMVNSHPFFCTCGIGLDAFISQKFAESGKRGLTTYIENALKTVLRYQPETYDLEVENESSEHYSYKAVLIACANACQWGNNAYIAPKASVHDGLLDVIIVEPFTKLEAANMAVQLMRGSLDRHSKIRTLRCKRVLIKRPEEGALHFDGDPMIESANVEVSIVKDGLKCVCSEDEGVQTVGTNLLNFLRGYKNNVMMRF